MIERLLIERRDSDGYFNGTNLCAAFKKRLKHYLEARRVLEYLDALAHSLISKAGIPASDFDQATNAVVVEEEASDHEATKTSPEVSESIEPVTAIVTRSFKGLVIERRDSDGYFNGTNLCAAFKKTFDNYLQTQRVSAYLDALAHLLLSTSRFREVDFDEARASIVQVQNGGASRGSWIHERVAMDLACWLSPDFAVWLDGWVLEAWVSHRSPRCLHCRCPRSQSMPLPPSKSVRDSSFRRTWRSGPSNNSEQKQR